MCIIIHKPKTGIIPGHILDNAQRINSDGFGITFLDDMETIKTLDYKRARVLVESERPFVAHYRYATRGKVNADNCHPFPTKDGVLYSNGTVADLGDVKKSDTEVVADMLAKTPKKYWKDMLSMTETRFAIVSSKGEVSRFGDWHMKDGVFYSKNNCFGTYSYGSSLGQYYNQTNHGYGGGWNDGYSHVAKWERKSDGTYTRKVTKPTEPVSPKVTKNNTVLGFGQDTGWDSHPDDDDVPAISDVDIMSDDELNELRGALSDDEIFEIAAAYNAGEMTQMQYQEALAYGITADAYRDDDDDGDAELLAARTGFELAGNMGDWEGLDILAVYGTLKHGYGNNRLLQGSSFLGAAESVEQLRMTGMGIPYLFDGDCDEGHHVAVELYEVKGVNAKLDIDYLEGHPNHYKRTRKMFSTATGIIAEAWVYIGQHEPRANADFYREFKR